jgi:hypothetical protein
MPRVLAIDWSGAAKNEQAKLWIAEALDGQLLALEGGRSRAEVVKWVCERRAEVPSCVTGIDFGFSFPSWFLDRHECQTIEDVWALTTERGEHWLAECPSPFWGRPGCARSDDPQLRDCEQNLKVKGISPKSVFQIGGAGAVGTGTIRGIPFLPQLREQGWAVWPFDAPTEHVVAEIWPRTLTGPVNKSSDDRRRAWLTTHAQLEPVLHERAAANEDAFDAAASAIVLSRCDDLEPTLRLPQSGDPREGAILVPPSVLNR